MKFESKTITTENNQLITLMMENMMVLNIVLAGDFDCERRP